MKILINTPSMKHIGGVSNHYQGLRAYWSEQVKYNTIGKRSKKNGSGIYWLPWDILKFIFRLLTFLPDLTLVNPSLGKNALKRDFLFINIAHILGFKTAIFIHGFNWEYAGQVNKQWVTHNLNRSKLIFVLAQAFKEELISWGVTTPIVLTTTKVNDKMLEGFSIDTRTGIVKNLLFLTRVEKEKGVYEAIQTFEILKRQYPELSLSIVGDGKELHAVKRYIAINQIADIRLTGSLTGQALIDEYLKGDLYIFPSYGEGMPTSVLEAMAFGLPVFTHRVGGLADFFKNKEMGYITDSLLPHTYAEAIAPYINNKELTRNVAQYNYQYAKTYFMASHVAKFIEEQLNKIL